MSVTILIADPAGQLRTSYREMLNSFLTITPKVTFMQTVQEVASFYESEQTDLVILDLKTSNADVFETARRIWNVNNAAKIIFLAESHKEWHLRQIKKLLPHSGLFGYIIKDQRSDRIGYGIECVLIHNNTYVDPLTNRSWASANTNNLTDAEYETLVDMALGLTDRVIAARRNVSVRGIQNRITLIFQKLLDQDPIKVLDLDGRMVNMRVRVVVEALRRGLLDVEHFASYDLALLDFVEGRSAAL